MIKKLEKNENLQTMIQKGIWLVDFSATWCGPCRMLEPVLESASLKYAVVTVDVDLHADLASSYKIMSVPSLFVFKDGVCVRKEVGYKNLEEIEEMMQNL